jgi:hypothetical protein
MLNVILVSVIQVSGPDCLCYFSICYTGFRSRWFMSLQYLLYSFQDQMVYVISVCVIQVSGLDGLCYFSICYTGFRTRWFMSFQYLLYRFQDQMVYVISVSVIQVSGPDILCHFSICYTGFRTRWCTHFFYLQCEVDDNEQVGLLLLRYSTFILFCSTSAPNTLFRHFDEINFYIFGENTIILATFLAHV